MPERPNIISSKRQENIDSAPFLLGGKQVMVMAEWRNIELLRFLIHFLVIRLFSCARSGMDKNWKAVWVIAGETFDSSPYDVFDNLLQSQILNKLWAKDQEACDSKCDSRHLLFWPRPILTECRKLAWTIQLWKYLTHARTSLLRAYRVKEYQGSSVSDNKV